MATRKKTTSKTTTTGTADSTALLEARYQNLQRALGGLRYRVATSIENSEALSATDFVRMIDNVIANSANS